MLKRFLSLFLSQVDWLSAVSGSFFFGLYKLCNSL